MINNSKEAYALIMECAKLAYERLDQEIQLDKARSSLGDYFKMYGRGHGHLTPIWVCKSEFDYYCGLGLEDGEHRTVQELAKAYQEWGKDYCSGYELCPAAGREHIVERFYEMLSEEAQIKGIELPPFPPQAKAGQQR